MRRLLLLAGVLALGAAGPAHSDDRVLRAAVGPDGLTLVDERGASVTRLAPGPATIVVDDRSSVHNVHLEGGGISRDSGLTFTGSLTWPVELADGYLSVVSDPQAGDLHLELVVGSPPAPSLTASVTASAIQLRDASGAPVERLAPGTYAIAVDDASTLESFRLVGPGVERHTQRHVAFRTTWFVSLSDGVYHFFSDRRAGGLRGSVTVGAGSAAGPGQTLRAFTGSDFAIALVGADGAPLTQLPAGDHTIDVEDRSPDHNFHLQGPGVNVTTTLEEAGRKTLSVRLSGGRYSFYCDPHTQTMFAEFTVPTAATRPTRLVATLTRDGRAALPGRNLRAGPYELVVRDRSPSAGFVLRGPGVRRATAARFVGTVTWRVRLVEGTYRYGVVGRLRTLVVSSRARA
jgi:hypothetical protein